MDPQEPILDHLNAQYWLGREGQAGRSPVQVARDLPTDAAVQTLRANYDSTTAEAAVQALIAEREPGGAYALVSAAQPGGIQPSGELDTGVWSLSNLWLFHFFVFGLTVGAAGTWYWTRSRPK